MRSDTHALRPFIIISIAYLLFTVTDGAIKMIVLLHAFNGGFSAMDVAIMFSLYELAGVGTNRATPQGIRTSPASRSPLQRWPIAPPPHVPPSQSARGWLARAGAFAAPS